MRNETVTVNLSIYNDLSNTIKNVRGAEKYKIIRDYILEMFDKEILFSDGLIASIDERDALHIAHKAGNKKVAAISKMNEIIGHSTYVAFEECMKGKYDLFLYYETKVKLGKDIYSVFINIGRTRNKQGYKIYDITQKLRESAHRINDVERLSKSFALEADSHASNIALNSPKSK